MFDELTIYCTEETKSNEEVKIWKELCGESTESCIVGRSVMGRIQNCFNISFPFLFMPVLQKDKWKYIIAAGAVGGLATIVVAPFILAAAGFTSAGVAAGSIAATIQSIFYGGATGGVFAALQSAGAAGIGLLGNAGLGVFGGSVGSGLASLFGKKKDFSLLIKVKVIGLYRETEKHADIELIKDFVINHLKLAEYTEKYFEVSVFTKMIDIRCELKTPAVLLFPDVTKN